MGSPRYRFICHLNQQKMLLLQGRHGQRVLWGCSYNLKCTPTLHFSPIVSPQQSPRKDSEQQSKSYLHCTRLALTAVVSPSTQASNTSTNHASKQSQHSLSTRDHVSSPTVSHSPSQGVVPRWFTDIELQCSQQVRDVLLQSSTCNKKNIPEQMDSICSLGNIS